jgi:uncharacterized membrane protein YjgN (DUF898 family)
MSAVSQQPPHGSPPPQYPYGPPPVGFGAPDHPQASTVLVLGILSLVLCQVIGPFAWVMGNRVLREIDASGGQLGGRSQVTAGRICGIVGTAMIAVTLLVGVVALVVVLIAASSSTS